MRRFWPFGRKDTAYSSTALPELLAAVMGGGPTRSGPAVNEKTALQVATVLACTRVIANGLAQVPFKLLQESKDGRTKLPARDHPLYDLLHRKPNDYMTSFQLRQTMAIHAVLCGRAYAFVNRVGDGRLAELIPIVPTRVKPNVADDLTVTYDVTAPNGARRTFPASAIWHWRGMSWDGFEGLEVVKLAREAIGLAMATEESQARLHANGMRTTGVVSVEGTLDETQFKSLRTWIEANFSGLANAARPMILDRKGTFTPASMTGVDAQHLETRRHQVEEICRFFGVLPIMIGFSDKTATYASAEQMFIAHLVHTMAPWYENIEQSADCFLLTDREREQGYHAKFVTAGLLRGDLKTTAQYLHTLVLDGVMTRNEARDKLDLNPLDGLDEPLTPANTVVGAAPADDADPAKAGA